MTRNLLIWTIDLSGGLSEEVAPHYADFGSSRYWAQSTRCEAVPSQNRTSNLARGSAWSYRTIVMAVTNGSIRLSSSGATKTVPSSGTG
jgi:hypothetical protein